MDIWQILMTPFSWVLKTFIQLFNSYGLGLIFFSIVVKLVLAPFQFKGKKSMIKMTVLNGQLQEIQKRCGQDKERYNREVQEFYTKNNVNPMGGCGWSMLPMLILFPLYAIIRRPFKYLMNLGDTASTAVANALGWTSTAFSKGAEFTTAGYNELYAASMIKDQATLGAAQDAAAAAGAAAGGVFLINFNFFGLDLSQIPSWKFWSTDAWAAGDYWGAVGLFLLPVLSAVLSFISMQISTRTNAMNQEQADAAAKQNRVMFLMMPLMSLWIGFSLPAGLMIYWIMNSVTMMIQDQIFNKMLKKDYEAAQEEVARQQAKEKEEEKERRRLAAEKKAAALAAGKNKAKNMAKNEEKEKRKGIDLSASREGIRAYARGRAYDPNRYPVTPYRDPDGKRQAPEEEMTPLTDEEKLILQDEGIEIPAEETQAVDVPESAEETQAADAPETAEETADAPEDETTEKHELF